MDKIRGKVYPYSLPKKHFLKKRRWPKFFLNVLYNENGEKMDIENVAKLARLSLSDEEKVQFKAQMTSILEYFEELSEVNTEGVAPLVTPTAIINPPREDKSEDWAEADNALSNAPQVKGNLFQVPPVV